MQHQISKTLSIHELVEKAGRSTVFLVVSFAVLTAVAAHVVIPATPVPFTLQTFAVLLSGSLLGSKKGFYSQLTYLALGSAGFPVFAPIADGTYGFMSLLSPTGGYLLAFPIAAYLVGFLTERNKSFLMMLAAMALGEIIIITLGVLFLNAFYLHDLNQAVMVGAGLFTIWTAAKMVAAAGLTTGFRKLKK